MVERYPGSELASDAAYRIGDCYFASGRFSQAVSAYQKMIADYAGAEFSDRAAYQIGQAYFRMEDYARANAAYDRVITRYPQSELVDEAKNMKGMSLFKQERYNEAIAVFQTIVKPSELADDALYQIGTCYYNMGDYDRANEIYRRVMNEFSDSDIVTEAITGMVESFMSRGEVNRAIDVVNEYLTGHPKGKIADTMLMKKGDLFYTLKNYDNAISAYRQLTIDYPESDRVPLCSLLGRYSKHG